MKNTSCPLCGGKTKRNGKTSSGKQRWRCTACNASFTHSYDSEVSNFKLFLSWLLSKKTQADMGMPARTFRHLTSKYWDLWPIAPPCDEVHHFVHVDGIWLKHTCVILIACTEDYVIGWHLARSENSRAWAALIGRIAAPDVVITDGGEGFEKARKYTWPHTKVQRCTYHVFQQVKRCTTTRPRTQAGVDLYNIAKALLKVENWDQAAEWYASYINWCTRYDTFLKERTFIDGKSQYKHERLRKAKRGLDKLCKQGTLFTYLDDELVEAGTIPATNNRIEGGINRQLRGVLNEHRGLRLDRMIKAVFWWCYNHLENPATPKEILNNMPTDDSIAELYAEAEKANKRDELIERWGTAVEWCDLHVDIRRWDE
jgi:hypothetical protein